MKKFFVTLLILVVLGGAVFLFGWVQLTVPPGSYGVINSKTHGLDPELVHSGEFRWVWYKLIPTNVQISVFTLEPETSAVHFSGALPSGGSYAAFAGISADFSWEITGLISFNMNPDGLIRLVTRNNIVNQEALNNYKQGVVRQIEVIIRRMLVSGETDSSRLESFLSAGTDEKMEREIAEKFPEICDFSFVVQEARFPDFVLYREVRFLYEEFLSRQREYVSAGLGKKAETHIDSRLHFDELERYGELLTKYPILLEYLELERKGIQ